jgi:hypothetical protein
MSILIVDAATLASSLGAPHTTASVQQTVDWTNALLTDEWKYPVTPVPPRIEMIGYAVAKRALSNPKGLESWTVTSDDASRTERLPKDLQRAGIYLTDDELRILQNPADPTRRRRRFRSIRVTPGY